MLVITISDIIGIILLGLFIVFIIYGIIENWFNKHFRQNCYDCKYYYLSDVASYGDCDWHRCEKNNNINDKGSSNDRYKYRKCKDFIER